MGMNTLFPMESARTEKYSYAARAKEMIRGRKDSHLYDTIETGTFAFQGASYLLFLYIFPPCVHLLLLKTMTVHSC